MRFFTCLLLLGLVGLVAVLLIHTLRLPNRQLTAVPAASAGAPGSALAHLAGALRIATVSRTRYADTATVPFDQLQAHLQRTFPLMPQHLRRQAINQYGLF